jgi:hypothetical protein
MTEERKSGARHSRTDNDKLREVRKVVRRAMDLLVELGAPEDDADAIADAADAATKGADLDAVEDGAPIYASIKALSDRTLELRVAWGWDGHKEQFHPELTDFDTENFPTPPVAYYHGYGQDGKPAQKPIYIGKTVKRENRADGHYLTAKLNGKPEADRVWAAALKGQAVVSPGTAGHLRRKTPDGTLTYWPIVEISAWDYADSRKQAHPHSIAFPILKALYQEANVSLPAIIDPAREAPEATGEVASVQARADDISSDEAGQLIAAEVARALLAMRKDTTRS